MKKKNNQNMETMNTNEKSNFIDVYDKLNGKTNKIDFLNDLNDNDSFDYEIEQIKMCSLSNVEEIDYLVESQKLTVSIIYLNQEILFVIKYLNILNCLHLKHSLLAIINFELDRKDRCFCL